MLRYFNFPILLSSALSLSAIFTTAHAADNKSHVKKWSKEEVHKRFRTYSSEKGGWRPEYDAALIGEIVKSGLLSVKLDEIKDLKNMCPLYDRMSSIDPRRDLKHPVQRGTKDATLTSSYPDRISVWLKFFKTIAFTESDWKKNNESGGNYGLFQLSVGNQCGNTKTKLKSEDEVLSATRNIRCAVEIMANQLRQRHNIYLNQGLYWETLSVRSTDGHPQSAKDTFEVWKIVLPSDCLKYKGIEGKTHKLVLHPPAFGSNKRTPLVHKAAPAKKPSSSTAASRGDR